MSVVRAALQRASALLKEQDFEGAASEAQDILRGDGDSPLALLMLGLAWHRARLTAVRANTPVEGRIGSRSQTESILAKAAGLQPFNAQIWRALAEVHESFPDPALQQQQAEQPGTTALGEPRKIIIDMTRLIGIYQGTGPSPLFPDDETRLMPSETDVTEKRAAAQLKAQTDALKALEFHIRTARACVVFVRAGRVGNMASGGHHQDERRVEVSGLDIYGGTEADLCRLGIRLWELLLEKLSATATQSASILCEALENASVPLNASTSSASGTAGVNDNRDPHDDEAAVTTLYREALRSLTELAYPLEASSADASPSPLESSLSAAYEGILEALIVEADPFASTRRSPIPIAEFGDLAGDCLSHFLSLRAQLDQSAQLVSVITRRLLRYCHGLLILADSVSSPAESARSGSRTLDAQAATEVTPAQAAICIAMETLVALYDEEEVDVMRRSLSKDTKTKRELEMMFIDPPRLLQMFAAFTSGTRRPSAALVRAWNASCEDRSADRDAGEGLTQALSRGLDAARRASSALVSPSGSPGLSQSAIFPPLSAVAEVSERLFDAGNFEASFALARDACDIAFAPCAVRSRRATIGKLSLLSVMSLLNIEHATQFQCTTAYVSGYLDSVLARFPSPDRVRFGLLTLACVFHFNLDGTSKSDQSADFLAELASSPNPADSLFADALLLAKKSGAIESHVFSSLLRGRPVRNLEAERAEAKELYSRARQLFDKLQGHHSASSEVCYISTGIACYLTALMSDESQQDYQQTMLRHASDYLRGSTVQVQKPENDSDPTLDEGDRDYSDLDLVWATEGFASSRTRRHRQLQERFCSFVCFLIWLRAPEEKQDTDLLLKALSLAPTGLAGRYAMIELCDVLRGASVRHRRGFLTLLESLSQKHPSDAMLWYYIGNFARTSMEKTHRISETAIQAFQNALRFAEDFGKSSSNEGISEQLCVLSWIGLAEFYSNEGKYEAAGKCYTKISRTFLSRRQLPSSLNEDLEHQCAFQRAALLMIRGKFEKCSSMCSLLMQNISLSKSQGVKILHGPACLLFGRSLVTRAKLALCANPRFNGASHATGQSARYLSEGIQALLNALGTESSSVHLVAHQVIAEGMVLCAILPVAESNFVVESFRENIQLNQESNSSQELCLQFGESHALEFQRAAEKLNDTDLVLESLVTRASLEAIWWTRSSEPKAKLFSALQYLETALGMLRKRSSASRETVSRIHTLIAHIHVLASADNTVDHIAIAQHHLGVAQASMGPDSLVPWARNSSNLLALQLGQLDSPSKSSDWALRALFFDTLILLVSGFEADGAEQTLAILRNHQRSSCFAAVNAETPLPTMLLRMNAESMVRNLSSETPILLGSTSHQEIASAFSSLDAPPPSKLATEEQADDTGLQVALASLTSRSVGEELASSAIEGLSPELASYASIFQRLVSASDTSQPHLTGGNLRHGTRTFLLEEALRSYRNHGDMLTRSILLSTPGSSTENIRAVRASQEVIRRQRWTDAASRSRAFFIFGLSCASSARVSSDARARALCGLDLALDCSFEDQGFVAALWMTRSEVLLPDQIDGASQSIQHAVEALGGSSSEGNLAALQQSLLDLTPQSNFCATVRALCFRQISRIMLAKVDSELSEDSIFEALAAAVECGPHLAVCWIELSRFLMQRSSPQIAESCLRESLGHLDKSSSDIGLIHFELNLVQLLGLGAISEVFPTAEDSDFADELLCSYCHLELGKRRVAGGRPAQARKNSDLARAVEGFSRIVSALDTEGKSRSAQETSLLGVALLGSAEARALQHNVVDAVGDVRLCIFLLRQQTEESRLLSVGIERDACQTMISLIEADQKLKQPVLTPALCGGTLEEWKQSLDDF